MTQIEALLSDEQGVIEKRVAGASEIPALHSSCDLLWIDLTDPNFEEHHRVLENFALDQIALEDLRKTRDAEGATRLRPKLAFYETVAFVVALSSDLSAVHMFIGPDWVVTSHDENDQQLWVDEARTRFKRQFIHDVPTLTWCILDTLVDRFMEAAEAHEKTVNSLEDQVLGYKKIAEAEETQRQLIEIRRKLVELHQRVAPLEDVIEELLERDEDDWLRCRRLYTVLRHKVNRTTEFIQAQRELTGHAADAIVANASNQMNQVMKAMTAWASILLGATLIAGIYGMNFDHIPEKHLLLGYPGSIGLMLLVSSGLFCWFKYGLHWFD